MNQSLSRTVVLLQRLDKRRATYLIMLDILQNFFMLDIFKKNSHLTTRKTVSGFYYQYSLKCYEPPTKNDQVLLSLRFLF